MPKIGYNYFGQVFVEFLCFYTLEKLHSSMIIQVLTYFDKLACIYSI